MLTGRESVGAAFAAVAHRRASAPASWTEARPVTWGELRTAVRSLALGLVGGGLSPGERRGVRGGDPSQRAVAALALLSVGAVLVEDADQSEESVEVSAVDELSRRGEGVDESHPSRYEELWQAVDASDAAVEGSRGQLTHDALLGAGRSFTQALGVDATDRILCPLEDLSGIVAGLIVPVLTGAARVYGAEPRPAASSSLPTIAVLDARGAERFAAADASTLAACRAVLVVDDDVSVARRLSGLGVRAHTALAVPGVAGLVTGLDGTRSMGGPFPGVTLAIDDDGEILLRAPGAPVPQRGHGWVRTGRHGSLDGDRLTLASVSETAG